MMELELDPHEIRLSLQASREKGYQWPHAWGIATNYRRRNERSMCQFMEKHFRAAYYRHDAPEGRWDIPSRDVSAAVGTGRLAASVVVDHEYCQSGDGCDREATRGRFGRMWCDHHADELERVSEALRMSREKADPRNGGNDSLYSHEAAA